LGEIFEQAIEDAAESPAGGDAAAVAVALERSRRRGGGRDAPADRFLEDQRVLVAKQAHHLDEQLRTAGLDRWFKRLKLATQGAILLLVLAAVAGLAALAWSAAGDRDLVIDGFSVPPDLAQIGATGGAVAHELRDRLGQLHEQTTAPTETVNVREKASAEARVEIPETGVSLSEVSRLLHDWLGRETHVSGEVSRIAAGPEKGALALSVRVGERPGVRIVQPDGDVDALLGKAAEQVYLAVEPFAYTQYLNQHGRTDEAIAIARRLSASERSTSTTPAEQGRALFWLTVYEGNRISRQAQRELLARSIELDPAKVGMINLGAADYQLGHTEKALAEARDALRLFAQTVRGFSATGRRNFVVDTRSNIGIYTGDFGASLVRRCAEKNVEPCDIGRLMPVLTAPGGYAGSRNGSLSSNLVWLHDPADAERLVTLPRDPNILNEDARVRDESNILYGDLQVKRERGDWAGVLADSNAWDALAAKWPGLEGPVYSRWKPVALAHLGDAKGARAAADVLPADCYPCAISHGLVEEQLGDRAAADRWFAEAVRQGPSLTQAEGLWAQAKLARGDVDGALRLAQQAYRKVPRFADASEIWAEALLMKGDAKGAAAKFEEAARLAPRWGRLRLKWGEALARLGRPAEARAQLGAATALDLTAAERTELAGVRR